MSSFALAILVSRCIESLLYVLEEVSRRWRVFGYAYENETIRLVVGVPLYKELRGFLPRFVGRENENERDLRNTEMLLVELAREILVVADDLLFEALAVGVARREWFGVPVHFDVHKKRAAILGEAACDVGL